MPRKSAVPRYTLHKPSGQGRARQQGRDIYFGPYDDPASHERYARFVAELAVRPAAVPDAHGIGVADPDLPLAELILRYLQFAQGYYGASGKEFVSLRDALKPVNRLYGASRAREFGPLALKAVRQDLISRQGLCRTEINRRMSRIKRAFKWAVSEELVPPSVFQGLQTVVGLRRGRSEATESAPVKPVPREVVEATLPFLSPPVAAICRLQLLTGMRPAEALQMRACDIDRSTAVWVYTPKSHKTQYLGRDKHVPLGPQAQEVVEPFLARASDAYLFVPAEAEAWRNEQRAAQRDPDRKTKVFPCELRSRERRKAARTGRSKRPFQPCYTPDSYRRAITYGINRARKAGLEIPHWFPYQIRHTHGTEVRRRFGLEAAQVALVLRAVQNGSGGRGSGRSAADGRKGFGQCLPAALHVLGGAMLSYPIGTSGQSICFTNDVIAHFERHRQTWCFHRESGGQLFATKTSSDVVVVQATGPRWTDRRTHTSYVPDRRAERNEIDEQQRLGRLFVGDWHTHPEPNPTPSPRDLSSIQECFRESTHELNGFLLVIVGTIAIPGGLFVSVSDGHSTHRLAASQQPEIWRGTSR